MAAYFRKVIVVIIIFIGFKEDGLCHEFSELNRLDVAPISKWFHLAQVTLTPASFVKNKDTFTASYSAQVIPFSYYNETGILNIPVSESDLVKFLNQKTFSFKGNAIREGSKTRLIKGEVIPKTASSGIIHIKIYYNRLITLTFDTTYTLPLAKTKSN
jgi:hypothetical protein